MHEGPQTTKTPHSKDHRQERHQTARAVDNEDNTARTADYEDITQHEGQTTETQMTNTQSEIQTAETVRVTSLQSSTDQTASNHK